MDKYLKYALEICFHNISPMEIIKISKKERIRVYQKFLDNKEFKKQFLYLMQEKHPNLSKDEVENAIKLIQKEIKNDEEIKHIGVFALLLKFTENTLSVDVDRTIVKFHEVINFRITTLGIGADVFACACLAEHDFRNLQCKRERIQFPMTLDTDNIRLKQILQEGLSENHFHLKGSGPSTFVSWICLMNHVQRRRVEFEHLLKDRESTLNSNDLFSDFDESHSYYGLVIKAAAIRIFLANLLYEKTDDDNRTKEYLKLMKLMDCDDKKIEANVGDLQRKINTYMQKKHGTQNLHNRRSSLDYLLGMSDAREGILRQSSRIFEGERKLLYDMFYGLLHEKNIQPYGDLFYTYLLIYAWFRGELIQNNVRTGFANFSDYQSRKQIFIQPNKYKKYSDAMIALAFRDNLNKDYMRNLEARIIPEIKRSVINRKVEEYDELAHEKDTRRYFYTIHFPKKKDRPYKRLKCRHDFMRRENELTAKGVCLFLKLNNMPNQRILGIDACSNEIGCRPEVFAQTFRYLTHVTSNVRENGGRNRNRQLQQLRITYHAGEDFLDVADGLRAIDEAFHFLEMKQGDRIGHALALGSEAQQWYSSKFNRVLLARQDIIDNSAWMLQQLKLFCYPEDGIYNELHEIYKSQFLNVYMDEIRRTSKYLHDNTSFVLPEIYMDAWKRRGDNPYLYNSVLNPNKKKKIDRYSNFENFNISNFGENRDNYKKYDMVWQLINRYHFSEQIRVRGEEIVELKISPAYVKAVSFIQKKMREALTRAGIGIECNPSSNYVIGTFKRYDKHPIFTFNHEFLHQDQETKMYVSINTDDLGVFDTSLENEYALLACALEKLTDDNGEPLYQINDIYSYLNKVREMGNTQSFNFQNRR